MSKTFQEELKELMNNLDEEDLRDIDESKITALRKEINPYGRTIEGSNNYLNFSITQINLEYWKNFIVTSFVGYLNRMNDEWKVPDGVPVVSVYDYLEDPSKLDTPKLVVEKGDKVAEKDYEFNRKWMEKRIIVKEFLEEMFQFNPDEHVRSAYRPNRKDKTRKPVDTAAGKLAVQHLKKTDKEFNSTESLYEEVNKALFDNAAPSDTPVNSQGALEEKKEVKTKKVKQTFVNPKTGKKSTRIIEVPVKETDQDEKLDETLKHKGVSRLVREMIPPQDLFGRFKIYYTNNLEELRDAVLDLYCQKPELELAINPYSWHATEDEAEAFKKKHADEVIAEVFTAHSGKWNFFDSFKEQREKTSFFNKDTIVLEEMIKQMERDEKLGQDLMKKRVQKAKKQNEIIAGPQSESFKKWREENSELKKLGATEINDEVDDDCPDDAIQVDVWKIAKGGTEITKTKFFSEAEAPTFMKEAQDKEILKNKGSGLRKQPAEPL